MAFTLTAGAFAENSPALSRRARGAIAHIEESLREVEGEVTVIGHTDPRRARYPGGNRALSKARAVAVVDALTNRGIASSRFVLVAGRGASELVDLGRDAASYRANRRVEVSLHCEDPAR